MKKFLIAFLVSLVLLSVVYVVFLEDIIDKDRPIGSDIEIDETGDDDFEETDDNKIEQKHPDEIFFAVLGVDGNGVKKEKGLRSDVIIVAKVNFETGEVDLMQINRDSRVLVQGKPDKINAAHSYGGANLAMRTLRDYLGVDLDYYIKVDFKGIMEIVDTVGGVEFDVPVRMRYSDPTAKPPLNIRLDPGLQMLNGQKSHDLLRFRHNNGTDFYPGGLSREKVQLDWIKAFAKTVLKPGNILKLPSIIKTTYNSVDTNIPINLALSFVGSANKIDPENMRLESLPGEGYKKYGAWYFFPDETEKERLVNEMFGQYKLDR